MLVINAKKKKGQEGSYDIGCVREICDFRYEARKGFTVRVRFKLR